MIKLTPRLETIAELVKYSEVAADIGTDHAYLPVSLIERGKTNRAIASDIAEGPLMRAAETVRKHHMSGMISLRLGAGLETLTPIDMADTIIIAGMGGETIAEILENSPEIVSAAKLIIAQPMSSVPEFRDYIYQSGYSDIREHLAAEGGKIYNIISMSPIKITHTPLEPHERLVGRDLLAQKPNNFDKYLKNLTNALEAKISGLSRAASSEAKAELERTKDILSKLS